MKQIVQWKDQNETLDHINETLDHIIGAAHRRLRDRKYRRLMPSYTGVVLRPRPVARAAVTPGVGAVGTPMNRGGPVDRAGRR